jgi:hypothetical protein
LVVDDKLTHIGVVEVASTFSPFDPKHPSNVLTTPPVLRSTRRRLPGPVFNSLTRYAPMFKFISANLFALAFVLLAATTATL